MNTIPFLYPGLDQAAYVRWLLDAFRRGPDIQVVAFTGGPCGGKSTILKNVAALLEKHGYAVFIIAEKARHLIAAGFRPWENGWRTPTSFQKGVLLGILHDEAFHVQLALERVQDDRPIVFLADRGIMDGEPYCQTPEDFKHLLDELDIPTAHAIDRYNGVIHLVTAANGAEEYYIQDAERRESPEHARLLDDKLLDAWQTHSHRVIVANTHDFPTKINTALLALRRMLNIPRQLEIERKWRIVEATPELEALLYGAKSYRITQTYLARPDRPGIECRVRIKVTDGNATYYYTEKTATEIDGVRGEFEKPIDRAEYDSLIGAYEDRTRQTIGKTRFKFRLGDLDCEFDTNFSGRLKGLMLLEVEFKDEEAMRNFRLPDGIEAVDITAQKQWSTASLARDGRPDQD